MKRNFWDILSWIAFGIVMAYFILKALHILKSPEIVDIITILSAGYFVGRYAMKTDTDIGEVKTKVNNLDNRISILENDMIWVKKEIELIKINLKKIMNKCFSAR